MTDKIQQARRAAFEAWAAMRWPHVGQHKRDALPVSSERYNEYVMLETEWQAFNAALDCIVIELPPELHAYSGQPQDERLLDADRNHTIKLCRAAIESTNLGVKVK